MKSYLSLTVLAIFLFFSCQSESGYADYNEARTMESQPDLAYEEKGSEQSQPGEVPLPDAARKIIRTANIRMRVNDLTASRSTVESAVSEYGGYVTSLEESSSNYERTARLTIRVPSDKLDALLAALDGESAFTHYKRIEARDVTEEYLDIETRLETKRAVRDRYIDILRNKAQTVEEVLLAEEQIRVIQEEIESREGRLTYLQNQVAMSTVNLELYEPVEYTEEPSAYQRSFGSELWDSVTDGAELLRDLVLGLFAVWPLMLLLLLLLWKGGWLWRKLRGR